MANANSEETPAPTSYFDTHFKCGAVKILPGEYFATARDILIVTVLGSCVSVCLRDRRSGIGGMNHFMLPGNSEAEFESNSARYGNYAMEVLINRLLELGAEHKNFEAKIFGGALMNASLATNQVGDCNADFVLNYLHAEKIPVAGQDLLDIYPRKVYFFPASGRVLVRKLKAQNNNTIVDRESEYRRKIAAMKTTNIKNSAGSSSCKV